MSTIRTGFPPFPADFGAVVGPITKDLRCGT